MNLPTEIVNNGKFKVEILVGDTPIGTTIKAGYEWDGWMRRDLDNFYRKGSDIIDVGGNIGYNTLMFSEYGNVHTFEPLFHEILNRNVKNNILKHSAHVYPYALGEKNIFSSIFFPKTFPNGSMDFGKVSMKPTANHSNMSKPVEVKRLDLVYRGIPSFMKIDVEGCEFEVLKGSERILKSFFPTIMIKIENIQESEIPKYLLDLGYKFVHPRPDFMYAFSLKNWDHVSIE
jgi:FkbM family methyltransferase